MRRWRIRVVILALLATAACASAQSHPASKRQRTLIDENCRPSWLYDDVRWIITPQERAAFCMLRNDEERQFFIENFWMQRDPTPTTFENEFKDEHYRRLAYANDHFGGTLPGRFTDRGRIYTEFGEPDYVEPCPNAAAAAPCLQWHYGSIAGLGSATFEFRKSTGDWTLTQDPSGGKNTSELGGGTGGRAYSAPWAPHQTPRGQIIHYVGLVMWPTVRFKQLEEVSSHRISYDSKVPIEVATSAEKVTNVTDLVTIRISFPNSQLKWTAGDETRRMHVELFARLTAFNGRVADIFEDELSDSVSSAQFSDHSAITREYVKVVPLPPGRYRLDVVLRDANADKVGSWTRGVIVPEFLADESPELTPR